MISANTYLQLDNAFDKFLSLQRLDNGRKTSGLELNFAKENALLHKGDVRLENRSVGSFLAIFLING